MRRRPCERIIRLFHIGDNPVNVLGILMIAIVTELIENIHEQKQAACNANRKAKDIDDTVDFVLEQTSNGDGEQIFEHGNEFSKFVYAPKMKLVEKRMLIKVK